MKIISRMSIFITVLTALFVTAPVLADEMIMARSARDFEETMNALQQAIAEHGYKVSKVQRVDVGLQAKGYVTDKYRVVFYGKAEEISRLSEQYPQLTPYLPLSVAIFSEGSQTMIATSRPRNLTNLFPVKDLQTTFQQWDSDLTAIFEEVRLSH